MGYWAECAVFFREYREHLKQTGSIIPSSRFLARALASEMARPRGPARILEVGPGTGPATLELARNLQPGDQLDCVELNDRFVAWLQRRLDTEPIFQEHRQQIRLIHGPVEQVAGEGVYDFIVSGLPLNAFPFDLVKEIFRVFKRLIRPGGSLSYFEYMLVRELQLPFVGREGRRRLHKIGRVVNHYIDRHQFRRDRVWLNVTPAYVRHLRLKDGAKS